MKYLNFNGNEKWVFKLTWWWKITYKVLLKGVKCKTNSDTKLKKLHWHGWKNYLN